MIVTKCLNSIISFFDTILPTVNLNSVMSYKDKFCDLAGYGAFFFGSSFLKMVFALVSSFIAIKFTVGVVQWIWEKIPPN